MPASQAGRRRFESGRPLQFFGKGLRDIEPVTPWRLCRGFCRISAVNEPSYNPTSAATLSKAEPSWLVRFGIERVVVLDDHLGAAVAHLLGLPADRLAC